MARKGIELNASEVATRAPPNKDICVDTCVHVSAGGIVELRGLNVSRPQVVAQNVLVDGALTRMLVRLLNYRPCEGDSTGALLGLDSEISHKYCAKRCLCQRASSVFTCE